MHDVYLLAGLCAARHSPFIALNRRYHSGIEFELIRNTEIVLRLIETRRTKLQVGSSHPRFQARQPGGGDQHRSNTGTGERAQAGEGWGWAGVNREGGNKHSSQK